MSKSIEKKSIEFFQRTIEEFKKILSAEQKTKIDKFVNSPTALNSYTVADTLYEELEFSIPENPIIYGWKNNVDILFHLTDVGEENYLHEMLVKAWKGKFNN